jgi:hypothetical protein
MKNKFQTIVRHLEGRLSDIMPLFVDSPVQYSSEALKLCIESHNALRKAFLNHNISDIDEIDFFKIYKPQLTSKLIFFNETFKIENNKPIASQKTIKKYYNSELKKLEQFVIDNAEFIKYYNNGLQYLDDKYFLRNKVDCTLEIDSFCFQNDNSFATSHDYKVAQIIANTELQRYLVSKLKNISKKAYTTPTKKLKWTSSKVDLVELIYALHTAAVFNHGNSDIREIVNCFCCAFDIEVSQFHRTFHEISNRKSDRAKFLNTLKECLINKMDKADDIPKQITSPAPILR